MWGKGGIARDKSNGEAREESVDDACKEEQLVGSRKWQKFTYQGDSDGPDYHWREDGKLLLLVLLPGPSWTWLPR